MKNSFEADLTVLSSAMVHLHCEQTFINLQAFFSAGTSPLTMNIGIRNVHMSWICLAPPFGLKLIQGEPRNEARLEHYMH